MAAMKPRTGDGPLEVTKEGRGIVMRVPLEGGGRLVVEMTKDEANDLSEDSKAPRADRPARGGAFVIHTASPAVHQRQPAVSRDACVGTVEVSWTGVSWRPGVHARERTPDARSTVPGRFAVFCSRPVRTS